MLFRQLFDAVSSTYTYLLACEDTREAVLIDGVFEQFDRDRALIRELDLTLVATLETHVHADHVTAASRFRHAVGSKVMLSSESGASGVDQFLSDGDRVCFGNRALTVRSTPGHTNGCVTFVLDDERMAFTGDALLIRGAGRTDFQQGDAAKLFASITKVLFTLPDACLLYPGHDYQGRTVTSVNEEKRWNARVGGGASELDFTGFMNNLALPHPKQIDVAVPANLRAGMPEDGFVDEVPHFGPVVRTFGGVNEIDAVWVNEHRGDTHVVDVRELDERTGELGSIDDTVHIPLGELSASMGKIPVDKPVIFVCRSGRRSAQACTLVEKSGRKDVANLAGGMIRWRALGLR